MPKVPKHRPGHIPAELTMYPSAKSAYFAAQKTRLNYLFILGRMDHGTRLELTHHSDFFKAASINLRLRIRGSPHFPHGQKFGYYTCSTLASS